MLATTARRPRLHLPPAVRAVLFCSAGVLLFACMDTTTKYLASRHDVPIIIAVRYLVNWLLLVAIVAPVRGRQMAQTRRTGLVLVRACSLAAVSLLMGLALQRIPVAEATAINFLAPMLVVVVAGPLLGEKVGAGSWATALIGFAGVLLIARPGSGLEPTGLAYALAAVGANMVYQLLSRTLASSERTTALLFYAALVGTIIFGVVGLWYWEGEFATGLELMFFLSLGVYGGLGHYLFTAAYRHATASVLAPVNYLQLFWAGLLGWLIFGHVPDWLSVTGMILIAASGLGAAIHPRLAFGTRERAVAGPLAE